MMKRIEIPERVVHGKRLGRHVKHDPRSLAYPFRAPVTLVSHRWSSNATPILDQGDLGSCTGNATVGSLLCEPFNSTLNVDQKAALNEQLAIEIYSRATQLDPFEGTYKPDDTGSDGLDVAKAAKEFGLISGYSHAFSLNDTLAALTLSPAIFGINWYSGMDNPHSTGEVAPTGEVRGGHEICLDEIDVENKRVWFRNSWTSSWGVHGRAWFTFDNLDVLLKDDGDLTVFTPLTAPEPTPIPIPTPEPIGDPDKKLIDATRVWVSTPHVRDNKAAAAAVRTWRQEKGL